eukprot:366537-Chlamydomonas_euryale.AAC.9
MVHRVERRTHIRPCQLAQLHVAVAAATLAHMRSGSGEECSEVAAAGRKHDAVARQTRRLARRAQNNVAQHSALPKLRQRRRTAGRRQLHHLHSRGTEIDTGLQGWRRRR